MTGLTCAPGKLCLLCDGASSHHRMTLDVTVLGTLVAHPVIVMIGYSHGHCETWSACRGLH